MISRFSKYISQNLLFGPDDNLLVAFSGGADSVCLLHLLLKSGYKVSLAHANFGLRGTESQLDESWVIQTAQQWDVPLFTKQFNTQSFAKREKIGIEEAARNLRYEWFSELMQQHGFNYLLTAHHADDQTETYLLNLIKGRGVSGQTGILPKRNYLVRPLLFAKKSEILAYCESNRLTYRNDSSNLDEAFQRNFLRLKVIPLLKELNPALNEAIQKEIDYRRRAALIYEKHLQSLSANYSGKAGLELSALKEDPDGLMALFRYLENYQFTFNQAKDLWYGKENGRKIENTSYVALVHQGKVVVGNRTDEKPQEVYWLENGGKIEPLGLSCEEVPVSEETIKELGAIFLDCQKLQFPLKLRHWQKGDYFFPSGMKGKKKLSDFFIDQKMSKFEKDNTWLLCSGDDIVWVVGKRLDGRFLPNSTSKHLLVLKLDPIS
ncbi:MAG: tRNA lysidine(34) synthetase TilS [Bacteroidia bacterium]|nr:tRNA lysidine(34) synthetase TilS [Bacteroidia bacterium]